LRQAGQPLHIVLINRNYPLVKGVAYGTNDKKHLLNVAAGKMSAFPDEQDHFTRWVQENGSLKRYVNDDLPLAYLPRRVYGDYLHSVFQDALKNKPSSIQCTILQDEARNILPMVNKYMVVLKAGNTITVDKVILATGNFPPAQLPVKDDRFYTSKNYFGNPWQISATENIKRDETVLILGSGLTMLDTALSIAGKNFKGKIIALSRSGLLPLYHKRRKPYPQLLDDLLPPYRLQELYSIYFKHMEILRSKGNPAEALMDAIRPKIQEIWMSLSKTEKVQFMDHVKPFWNVTRHRASRQVHEAILRLIEKNTLAVEAGRLISMTETGNSVEVIFREKKTLKNKIIRVNRVINCTGPETDITKINDELIKNLLGRGFIAPDELNLGMNALFDGTIIQRDNSLSPFMYTLGTSLKGILWESTAVPELRSQVQQLAAQVLRQLFAEKPVKKKIKI
jgi:uncharacterized NAD(P)/FAD-binding protein YdhS